MEEDRDTVRAEITAAGNGGQAASATDRRRPGSPPCAFPEPLCQSTSARRTPFRNGTTMDPWGARCIVVIAQPAGIRWTAARTPKSVPVISPCTRWRAGACFVRFLMPGVRVEQWSVLNARPGFQFLGRVGHDATRAGRDHFRHGGHPSASDADGSAAPRAREPTDQRTPAFADHRL
ncbi:hypothetical protein FRUB_01547 [Fimbriiglobus ruber]|uniref:Uncharacterized protein n=1 Tax=Fimbriiglobus ruber TaxID=1908690 RepID=A0A225E539_9BACT|nr:hypothetical protein FRUB_01547 [Fimbriiglobus ruber]